MVKEGAIIIKKEMNIPVRFWFGFISSNLRLSQNKSVLEHTKVALVGSIMDHWKLNLGAIITLEIITKVK